MTTAILGYAENGAPQNNTIFSGAVSATSNRSAISFNNGEVESESGVNIFDPPQFSSNENLLGDAEYTPNIIEMNDGDSLTDSQSKPVLDNSDSDREQGCGKLIAKLICLARTKMINRCNR